MPNDLDSDSRAAGRMALARLAGQMAQRADELATEVAALIRRQVSFHLENNLVDDDELRESIRANLLSALSHLGAAIPSIDPARVDLTQARATGQRRAASGVPLPVVMDGYRIGVRHLWRAVVEQAHASGAVTDATLVAAASDLWAIQDELTTAMTGGYRDELTARLLVQEEERSALVEALLGGRPLQTATLWEIAELLRIGQRGPYVVITAELADVGRHSLRGVESALKMVDVPSAWRLTPDLQIGIVQLRSPEKAEQVLSTIRRLAITRVGVSPSYDDLADTAPSLRLARIAMSGSIPGKAPVTVFDSDALAVTAMASPEITQRVASRVLAGLSTLPASERQMLLDTFEAWLDCGGSTAQTAAALHRHDNTVRHRLHRLEELTDRSLSDPRELAELCNALEVDRRAPK